MMAIYRRNIVTGQGP